ncbi:AMP-binding protein [Pseudomonas promysalinigenes]|uniref:AMP-binding protein n=1 Tax=Pseudomonas promysalinigenes TaxID=485898 RepID=UPI003917538F
MKGFDFQQLARRVASFAASIIEGPSSSGGRTSVSFGQMHERAVQLAGRLRTAGMVHGEVLAIRSSNCIEWVIWDMACLINGHVLHVFLEDLAEPATGEVQVRYGYRLFADARATGALAHGVCHLMEEAPLILGPGEPLLSDDPDVYSLVYSSGSSGAPKGLKISRCGTEYLINQFLNDYQLDATDRSLMFMPLSNFQQRMSMYAFLWTGTSFSLTDLDNAYAAARNFSPSYMVAPPSFYENALQRFPGLPGAVDSLKNGLGGALRFVHVGMAPATGDPIGRFEAQGIAMYEAYGVTEAGMVAWNTPKASRAGSVGKPVNPNEVFLDDSGEVIVRRKWPLCLGYFEASQDDQDNTFRAGDIATGDFGEFDDDGFLYLRGRSNNQIELPSGVRLQPETIERAVRGVGAFDCCLAFFDPPRGVLQC